jgi:hypothetical protein
MAQTAGFVPAWKRLGLKLTHFKEDSQSGVAVSEVKEPHDTKQHSVGTGPVETASKDDAHRTELADNGKSHKLGKRKAQEAPAEEVDNTFKKSRTEDDQDLSRGNADDSILAPLKEAMNKSPSIAQAPSTSERPTGDSNYRQKKSKGGKLSQKERATLKKAEKAAQSAAQRADVSQTIPQVRSPSPGDANLENDEATLLPSTETDFLVSQSAATIDMQKKTSRDTSRDIASAALESTPPRKGRRKSVTFTPDTKTADGDSASNLFKKWVLEQKGTETDFSASEVAQFAPPPKVHPANGIPTSQSLTAKEERQAKRSEKKKKKEKKEARVLEKLEETHAEHQETPTPTTVPAKLDTQSASETIKTVPVTASNVAPKGKKKDPSLYLSYLSQYHNDRAHWKFNKAKQNDVLDNALNIFRIPDEYVNALLEYIKGLKGASVVERLTEKSNKVLVELDEEAKQATSKMDDVQVREVAKQEALEERLWKEKRRREFVGDIEAFRDHPYPEGFVRRLKRRRAEALLGALNMAAPIRPVKPVQADYVPPPRKGVGQKVVFDDAGPTLPTKPVRKRKSRTEVSDSSSSDSSSDDSSSSDSDSDSENSDEDIKSTSGSSSSSGESDSSEGSKSPRKANESDSDDSSLESKSGSSNSDENDSSESE